MPPLARLLRLLLPVALLVPSTGCVRWQEIPVTVAPARADTVDRARIQVGAQPLVLVDNLVRTTDSLTGLLPNSSPPGHPPQRFAVASGSVTHVYERQPSLTRTIAAVAFPVIAAAGALFLLGL